MIILPNPTRVQELVFLDFSGEEQESWNPEQSLVATVEILVRCEDEQCYTCVMKTSKDDCITAINRILTFWKHARLFYNAEKCEFFVTPFLTDTPSHTRIKNSLPPKA